MVSTGTLIRVGKIREWENQTNLNQLETTNPLSLALHQSTSSIGDCWSPWKSLSLHTTEHLLY